MGFIIPDGEIKKVVESEIMIKKVNFVILKNEFF